MVRDNKISLPTQKLGLHFFFRKNNLHPLDIDQRLRAVSPFSALSRHHSRLGGSLSLKTLKVPS